MKPINFVFGKRDRSRTRIPSVFSDKNVRLKLMLESRVIIARFGPIGGIGGGKASRPNEQRAIRKILWSKRCNGKLRG